MNCDHSSRRSGELLRLRQLLPQHGVLALEPRAPLTKLLDLFVFAHFSNPLVVLGARWCTASLTARKLRKNGSSAKVCRTRERTHRRFA